jgi:hypothetical protein
MTIQEAINKAIEGGYPRERVADPSYFTESLPLKEQGHQCWKPFKCEVVSLSGSQDTSYQTSMGMQPFMPLTHLLWASTRPDGDEERVTRFAM